MSSGNTSNSVLNRYYEVHGSHLSGKCDRSEWFTDYVDYNYIPYLRSKKGRILEFGCGDGYVLEALQRFGFDNLEGIDISPEYAEISKERVAIKNIFVANVFDYLKDKTGLYNAIISKAVLEHLQKEKLSLLISMIYDALEPGGVFIVDVPNMDWICASHERYMDITHHNGFTPESLESVLRLAFKDVKIFPSMRTFPISLRAKFRVNVLKPIAIWGIRQMFRALGNGEASTWFEHRSIIGVAVK